MVNLNELEQALSKIISHEYSTQIHKISQLLLQVLTNPSQVTAVSRFIERDIDLQMLVASLANQEIRIGDSLVRFGSNSQVGDITFRDLAGRDITHLHFNIRIVEQNSFLPAHQQFLRLGQMRMARGNIDEAIKHFTKSIEVLPSTEAFIARALAWREKKQLVRREQRKLAERSKAIEDVDKQKEIDEENSQLAGLDLEYFFNESDDINDAIAVAKNEEEEKRARLLRVVEPRIFADEEWVEDYKWLEPRVNEDERTELLIAELDLLIRPRIDLDLVDFEEKRGLAIIEELTRNNKYDSRVALRHAQIELMRSNFGNTLRIIKVAISRPINSDVKFELLRVNARALWKLGKLDEAYSILQELQTLKPHLNYYGDFLHISTSDIISDALYRIILSTKYGWLGHFGIDGINYPKLDNFIKLLKEVEANLSSVNCSLVYFSIAKLLEDISNFNND
jgi:tetratricopeptide (TPR) repeat protein